MPIDWEEYKQEREKAAQEARERGRALDEKIAELFVLIEQYGERREAQKKIKNCPFYGRALCLNTLPTPTQPPFILFDSQGNQCGLVVSAHSPCQMEMRGEQPNWQTCRLVREARGEWTED